MLTEEEKRENARLRSAQRRKDHPITEQERVARAARSKVWREQHPEYMKGYMKEYRPAHLEEMRANDRQYHADHRSECNAKRRQWALDNPEKNRLAIESWRIAHPEMIKESYLKRLYGLTLADYEVLLAKQGGGCAICNGPPGGPSKGKYFHVDHDHVTGKVRGLLCHNHNTGLGLIGDTIEALEKTLRYLKGELCLSLS